MAKRSRGGRSLEDALTRHDFLLRPPLLLGSLLTLALVVTLGLVLVWRQYEDARSDAAKELESRAILAATVFDTYFAGQLQALTAIAASPTVVSRDVEAMNRYFAQFRPKSGATFTAGVGWIDRGGRQRATSDPAGPRTASLADRTYFKQALATGKPVVGEAIVARATRRRLVVMGVPTRDAGGRITGVLAGGIVLRASGNDERATDLGYAGLTIIDRRGQQVTLRNLARPRNADLLARLTAGKEGVLVDVTGLDGSGDHVVAYATAATPGWKAVLDQPTSVVFADARSSLVREVSIIGAAGALLFGLLAWAALRARKDFRRNRAQVARWSQLSRSLNEASSADEVAGLLADVLARESPEATVLVHLASDGPDDAPPAIAPGSRSALGGLDGPALTAVSELLARGRAPVSLGTRAAVTAELGSPGQDVGSVYSVPLSHSDGRRAASAAVLFEQEHGLTGDDLSLLRAYADQAGQTLERLRRHEDEHDAAVLLQQSLLPAELPAVDGIDVTAYYRAGALNTQVGGDWYDAVRRPDGIVHLTVGDVAGRGLEAAVAMGQLRNAFRAYALEHVSPAAVLQRLTRHVPDEDMATVVCATYDPYTRELAYASAGHLPPLLVDWETQDVTRLSAVSSAPLGWRARISDRDEPKEVPRQATLALYTDGLVERRDAGIDEGIDLLAATLLEAGTETENGLEALVLRVVPRVEDDLALLLVRLHASPETMALELPAQPSSLRELRRRVHAWLTQRGVEKAAQEATVLALHEACANAIEHAYRDTAAGTIDVRLSHRGPTLEISVEDTGVWHPPTTDPLRGRGFPLMRGLMRSTDVRRDARGTRVVLTQDL